LRWSLREVSQWSSSAMAVVDGTGAALGKRLEATWLPNGQGLDALNIDFLERRPRNSADNLKIALWQITATGGETPEVPYPKEEILDFLETTWTDQANVHFEVIQDWAEQVVDYDLDGDGDLTLLAERDDIRLTAVNSNADIDVYLVHRMPEELASRLSKSNDIFIAEINKAGTFSSLSALAQEVGHVLGIPESADDDEDGLNVMSDPGGVGSQIRRVDWEEVQEEINL